MKINPKEHAETYRKQEALGSFAIPPSGTYVVVNTKVTKQVVGQNSTPRLRYKATILAHVESEGGEGEGFVGKTLSLDLWANWEKMFNVQRVSHMGIACGQTDAWDPEDPGELVKATTGVPYQLKMVRKESEYQGKVRQDAEPVEFKSIGVDARAKYTKSPDWQRTVGSPSDRYEDAGVVTPKSGATVHKIGAAKGGQADPFKDDDIPF